jgi:hypothetical protein
LTITTTSLPDGQINVPYSATLTAAGGTPPDTWAVTGGALPTGVNVDPSSGIVSGTPTVNGTFTVTFGVNDSGNPVQTASKSFTFIIVGPPVITQASPSSLHQGDTNQNVVLVGQFTHFVQGQTTVSFSSADITVNSVTVNSQTSVTANISITVTALIGARNVTVTTGSEVAVGNSVFTVQAGLAVVSLSPNFGVQGTNPTITINGTFTHFTQGQTTANFSGNDITAGAVTVNSPTLATVQIQISVVASLGQRTIVINTGSESAPGTFNVTAGAPIITSVNPNVGGQGVTSLSVTVNANFTSWVNGTTVASFGSGISVGGATPGGFGPVTVNGSGQFTATVSIAAGATLGPRDVTVKTGTEQEVAGGAFTVENCTTTAAIVLYTSPVYGVGGVPLNTNVQWEFNAPLNRSAINANSVRLYDGVTGLQIPSTVSLDATGRIVTLVPSQLLAVGRAFNTYLGYQGAVTDACGNALSAFTQFTTTFTPETSGPSVIRTSPINNDINVPLNAQIVLQLNVPVDPLTLQDGFTVSTGGTAIPGTYATMFNNNDYTRVVFTPLPNLTAMTTYTVTYGTELTDDVGNPLVNPGSFSFTTGTATDTTNGSVMGTDPQYAETNIGTNVTPTFYLSKIADPISIDSGTVYMVNANTGKLIASTVAVSADRMHVTMTPSAPLQPGTTYYEYKGYGHQYFDLAGNPFSSAFLYFTTAGSAITAGPVVTQISPPDGTAGAPVNTQVVAVTSGLIDPNTVGNNAITVTPQGSTTPVPATVTLGSDQVTLTWVPLANLSTSTKYNVTVAGFADTQGNAVASFTSSFTTGSNGTPVGAGSLTAVLTSPVNTAVNVSNNARIDVTFSEVIDLATVINILVLENGSYSLAGTWGPNPTDPTNGAKVSFTPAQPYPAGAVIYVWDTTNHVRDLAGNTDTAYLIGTFTISSTATDTTAPTVTSVTPINNATGIGRNAALVLTFSKSINPGTVNANTIGVFAGESQIGVGYTMSANNRTVIITATWPAATTITVVATAKVQDFYGNSLVPSESQFTTAADFSTTQPRVVTQRPANSATDVPPNAVITLFTSGRPLNPSTVTPNSLHVSHNGVLIDGTINITGNNQAIEFVPSQNFNYGDIVQIFLDATIQDVDGNALVAFQGSFTIQANPGTTGPTLLNTNPPYGATGVPANPDVRLQFDQALAPSTINATSVLLCPNNNCSTPAAGTVSLIGVNSNIVEFKVSSSSPLTSNTYYYLNLINVTNAQGVALTNSYYVYFQTGTATNTTPPTVLSVGPPDGATGVGVNASIIATFGGAIDPVSVTGATIQITGGSQTVVPSSISFGRLFVASPYFDYVSITPQAPLPANTVMAIAINGVTDPEGNAVTAQTTHFTTGPGPVLTNPSVILASWQYGDTVATNASFSLEFDRPMDPGTVNNLSMRVYDATTAVFLGESVTLSSDLRTETATPSAPLTSGDTIYIYSAYFASPLDLSGNPQNSFFATAIVGSGMDTTPPVVLETNPPANLTGVPLNAPIQIEFSKEIAQDSIGSVQLLLGSTPVAVTPSFSRLSTVLTLTPSVPLLPNTTYSISITGVTDTAGNTFSGTQTVNFTTGPAVKLSSPVNVSVAPCCSQTGVSNATTIQIVFDSPMDPLTFDTVVGNAVLELSSTSAVVPTTVSFSLDFKTVILTPSAALASATSYTVVVRYGSVTDVAGNPYNNAISTSFTTQ